MTVASSNVVKFKSQLSLELDLVSRKDELDALSPLSTAEKEELKWGPLVDFYKNVSPLASSRPPLVSKKKPKIKAKKLNLKKIIIKNYFSDKLDTGEVKVLTKSEALEVFSKRAMRILKKSTFF